MTTTGRISGVGVYLFSIQLTQLTAFLPLEVLVWDIAVFSSLAVVTVISNILVMCIWLKPDIRSYVTILLAALSLSDSIAVILPGICLPIVLYCSMQDIQTMYILFSVISYYIPLIFHSFSILVTTIVAMQQLCICAFPFKARFLFTMRNTVIAMVTTFFICVMMVLPYLMISNVTAEKRLFSNNDTMLIVDVDSVLSQDFILAYINDYLPYFRLFGIQILPMCIVMFSMVYCVCTITRRRHQVQMSNSSQNTMHRTTAMICLVMTLFISGEFPTTLSLAFEIYGKDSDNYFVYWLGFTNNGVCLVNVILVVSYQLNIWVYVFMSKSFRERLLTMLSITSARKSLIKGNNKIKNSPVNIVYRKIN